MAVHFEPGGDHTVRITIDRPAARNALDVAHFSELRTAWDRFADDDQLWVAVVTGVGDAFCVGADLKTYVPEITALRQRHAAGASAPSDARLDDGMRAVLAGVELYKPVVAAVNGTCVGGGMVLLGNCDLRVASENATFGVMEPKRGLFASGGATVQLPRQLPFPAAMELLLCADRLPARRVWEMGLLNEVTTPEQLLERAHDYARRIAANGPLAVRKTKEAVLRGLAVDMTEASRIESELSDQVFASEDAVEGPRAFAERRPPVWKNR